MKSAKVTKTQIPEYPDRFQCNLFSVLISKINIADILTILVVYFYSPPYLTIQGATNQDYKMNTWVYNPYNHPLSSFPSLFMNADIVFEAA